jgi:hypothetical protein
MERPIPSAFKCQTNDLITEARRLLLLVTCNDFKGGDFATLYSVLEGLGIIESVFERL